MSVGLYTAIVCKDGPSLAGRQHGPYFLAMMVRALRAVDLVANSLALPASCPPGSSPDRLFGGRRLGEPFCPPTNKQLWVVGQFDQTWSL